ncbi:GNAT family N-acetyltransferase [Brucella sp. HL-2]|nr:GNAT family N-acetyltransferase [Brucella sp. HL-2]MCV9909972.1 GNAT family N-acetyltransferase [Brucella sp. HL-2]
MHPLIIDIQTERLQLRPFSAADSGEAFDSITPTLTRFMAFDPPPSRSAFEVVWRRWLCTIADGSDLTFVIRHRESGSFIGLAGLHNTQSPEPELGIWVSEQEHGHGYGREAVRAVVKWSASVFSPRAFRYPVAEANHASRRIPEEMGGQVVDHDITPKYRSVIYRIPSTHAEV